MNNITKFALSLVMGFAAAGLNWMWLSAKKTPPLFVATKGAVLQGDELSEDNLVPVPVPGDISKLRKMLIPFSEQHSLMSFLRGMEICSILRIRCPGSSAMRPRKMAFVTHYAQQWVALKMTNCRQRPRRHGCECSRIGTVSPASTLNVITTTTISNRVNPCCLVRTCLCVKCFIIF